MPGRALEMEAHVGSAFVSRSPDAALSSLLEVVNFSDTGKGLYFCKFVQFMLYKRNKKQIDYTYPHQLKNIDFEQRLEKTINDVDNFNNHINNTKELITYFKDKNLISKRK